MQAVAALATAFASACGLPQIADDRSVDLDNLVTLVAPRKLDDRFHQMTTRVVVGAGDGISQGTGFFYQVLGKAQENGHRRVEEMWVVTNRHVLLPKSEGGDEQLPSVVEFYLRGVDPDSNQRSWVRSEYRGSEIEERLMLHPDPRVDVALIGIDVGQIAAYAREGSPDHPYALEAPYPLSIDHHVEQQDV
ncbi:MAG: hypothetical protein OXS50_01730, partial [Gammaproteobacteria bacterium]|nr:hypothetical protein [Gammaproteobacteria bacterium]